MKKNIFILIVSFCIVFSMSLFSCKESIEESNPFHAEVLYEGYEVREEFLMKNITRNSCFIKLEGQEEYLNTHGEEFSTEYLYILEDEEEETNIFSSFNISIDYKNETLLVYIFTSYVPRPYYVKRSYMDLGVLYIRIMHESMDPFAPGLSAPLQKCLVIKVDKTEKDDVIILRG
ncbi:MAG: hypothetical protein K5753_04670 [Clostridia bacterium]|nr:hypothetical protein [Clostridia bacterium]